MGLMLLRTDYMDLMMQKQPTKNVMYFCFKFLNVHQHLNITKRKYQSIPSLVSFTQQILNMQTVQEDLIFLVYMDLSLTIILLTHVFVTSVAVLQKINLSLE
jgi:hypothetical protein